MLVVSRYLVRLPSHMSETFNERLVQKTFEDTRKTLHKALSKSWDQHASEFLVVACKTSPKAFWSKRLGKQTWKSAASYLLADLKRKLRLS